MVKKGEDYLGFGCEKLIYYKKQKNDSGKFEEHSKEYDGIKFANILLIESEYLYMI